VFLSFDHKEALAVKGAYCKLHVAVGHCAYMALGGQFRVVKWLMGVDGYTDEHGITCLLLETLVTRHYSLFLILVIRHTQSFQEAESCSPARHPSYLDALPETYGKHAGRVVASESMKRAQINVLE